MPPGLAGGRGVAPRRFEEGTFEPLRCISRQVATVLTPGDEMELCGAVPTLSRPDADAVIIVGGLTGDDPKA